MIRSYLYPKNVAVSQSDVLYFAAEAMEAEGRRLNRYGKYFGE